MPNETATLDKEVKMKKDTNIYASPSNSWAIVGVAYKGVIYHVNAGANNYYAIDDGQTALGWVKASNCTLVKSNAESEEVTSEMAKQKELANQEADELRKQSENRTTSQKLQSYREYINDFSSVTNTGSAGVNKYELDSNEAEQVSDTLLVKNLTGIWGMPYQFAEDVDPSLPGTTYGSIYSERILERMPLLIISPGKMDFMSEFSDQDRNVILDALSKAIEGLEDISGVDEFLENRGKYYTFQYDADTYWRYVNTLNRASAVYLGIADVAIQVGDSSNATAIKNIDWRNSCNSAFKDMILSSEEFVVFYCDADSSISNSFSNETTPSSLAQKVNDYSALAKEVQFILGTHGVDAPWLKSENISNVIDKVAEVAGSITGQGKLIKDVANEFSVIASGGKLAFPEIWSDSSFSQAMEAKLKLRCPCPNKIQWYLDICVPMNLLLALTLPRTPTGFSTDVTDPNSSSNGYMSPFLIRAFYKGLYTCDMGIITELSFDKGKEGSWTIDGLPTEVDVTIGIKDLYNVLFQTQMAQREQFLDNTTFLNYIANMCGVNINKPDVVRSVNLYTMAFSEQWSSKLSVHKWWSKFSEGITNKVYSIYTGLFRG